MPFGEKKELMNYQGKDRKLTIFFVTIFPVNAYDHKIELIGSNVLVMLSSLRPTLVKFSVVKRHS